MRHLAMFILVALLFLPGCGGSLGPDSDRDVADKALRSAMEAWKNGKSQDDLEKESPSIIMNEDDWRTGKRLIEFKIEECTLSGRQVRCRVRIKLQDKDGKSAERNAVYIIDTTPRIVIVRDRFAASLFRSAGSAPTT
jgi:hypothetical protein